MECNKNQRIQLAWILSMRWREVVTESSSTKIFRFTLLWQLRLGCFSSVVVMLELLSLLSCSSEQARKDGVDGSGRSVVVVGDGARLAGRHALARLDPASINVGDLFGSTAINSFTPRFHFPRP